HPQRRRLSDGDVHTVHFLHVVAGLRRRLRLRPRCTHDEIDTRVNHRAELTSYGRRPEVVPIQCQLGLKEAEQVTTRTVQHRACPQVDLDLRLTEHEAVLRTYCVRQSRDQ